MESIAEGGSDTEQGGSSGVSELLSACGRAWLLTAYMWHLQGKCACICTARL
jgi:hypothetical protein